MLDAFIVTLREGVEAALIVGITLAYLTKIGRTELRKAVYGALIAAFLGSIGVAIVISRAHLNEDVFEGWVMLVAAFFVVTMVIFMMKTGRKMKGEIEGKVGLLASNNAWFGLFIFIFLMVLREGGSAIRNADLRNELSALAAKISRRWIIRSVAAVDEVAELLRRNIQKPIAFDGLLMQMRSAATV